MRAKRTGLAIQALFGAQGRYTGCGSNGGVSYNRFLREVQARNIVILEDNGFLDRLGFLADAFDDEDLRSAIKKVIRAETGTP